MNRQTALIPETAAPSVGGDGGGISILREGENLFLTFALAAMVLIPLLDAVLRRVSLFISGSSALEQHLTLVVCMAGGALAAREGRLLSLSTVTTFLKGRVKSAARLYSGSFGAAITILLCAASVQFVLIERPQGKILAYGIPYWVVEAAMPVGFGIIAVRLLRRSAAGRRGRALAILIAGVILAAGLWPPLEPSAMAAPALVLLLAAAVLGAPIFVVLGGAGLILFWGMGDPIAMMPIAHYDQVVNPALPAIPLFTLAGYLLAEGGAAPRLIRVFRALVGHFRGGPAIAAVLVCAFFTSFTGASGVTILALGGLLMPVLLSAGYSEKNALGLLTGSGSIGLLFPPCLPIILYAIIARVDIDRMFLGGILPGILLVLAASVWGVQRSPKSVTAGQTFDLREAWAAVWAAKWELLLPFVAMGAFFSGIANVVQASALTAFYAFAAEAFFYRDLKVRKDLPRVMAECGLLVGAVLLILGVALGFTSFLIQAQIPLLLVEWIRGTIHSPLIFLLALNFFLLLVGCLMDIFSAIIVVVPLIVPMGAAFGIDPVHLGVIFLANLELGYLTPPVGMNLFLSSYRFNQPLPVLWSSIVPVLLVLLGGVLLITYVPSLSTLLPSMWSA